MKARSPQPYPCGTCPAAGADLSDLETHILADAPGHRPAKAEHVTPRIREAVEAEQRRDEVREALAKVAKVTVDELRDALRGWH